MLFVIAIAQTHFYIATEEDLALRETLKQMPKEDRLFYDLMCFGHGNKPIQVRPAHCVVNSDDTTEFICKGIQPKKSKEIGLRSVSTPIKEHNFDPSQGIFEQDEQSAD